MPALIGKTLAATLKVSDEGRQCIKEYETATTDLAKLKSTQTWRKAGKDARQEMTKPLEDKRRDIIDRAHNLGQRLRESSMDALSERLAAAADAINDSKVAHSLLQKAHTLENVDGSADLDDEPGPPAHAAPPASTAPLTAGKSPDDEEEDDSDSSSSSSVKEDIITAPAAGKSPATQAPPAASKSPPAQTPLAASKSPPAQVCSALSNTEDDTDHGPITRPKRIARPKKSQSSDDEIKAQQKCHIAEFQAAVERAKKKQRVEETPVEDKPCDVNEHMKDVTRNLLDNPSAQTCICLYKRSNALMQELAKSLDEAAKGFDLFDKELLCEGRVKARKMQQLADVMCTLTHKIERKRQEAIGTEL